MHRITLDPARAAVAAALDLMPARIADLLRGTHVLAGCDPVFVGLHRYGETLDGRSYRDTAHVVYDFHQPHRLRRDRDATLVLPDMGSLNTDTIVHEFGHVLDSRLGFTKSVLPVTWYAETDRYEAFAEAFTAWVLSSSADYATARHRLLERDQATCAYFGALAD